MRTLKIPVNGTEIQVVGKVKYLVARLDEQKSCSEFLLELQSGNPVVVPFSKRAYLTGLLKEASIFTRQKTLVAGQWISFSPCGKREFKP